MKRYAVCLFGEFRTADYCAPWLKDVYRFDDGETDFFCDYKVTGYEANNMLKPQRNVSSKEIGTTAKVLGAKYSITPSGLDSLIGREKPHFSRMFSSISRVVTLKQHHEIQHDVCYDSVFLSRHDAIPGPDVDILRRIRANAPRPLTLHVSNTSGIRFFEAHRSGFPDIMMYGNSYAIDAVAANAYRYWVGHPSRLKPYHSFGPNVFLSMISSDAGLSVIHETFDTAVVRLTADLSKPIANTETWRYLQNYEIENATWNPKNT